VKASSSNTTHPSQLQTQESTHTQISSLAYTDPKGYAAVLSKKNHYSQAVRLPTNPPTLKISGQCAWDLQTGNIAPIHSAEDIFTHIDLAFSSVHDVLRCAGSQNGWGDVYLGRVYFVG
jgi:enamine deaminase RidA (YjgF/YER057c/UK114 family)